MIRSMTGYGRSETVRGSLRLTVEMRAVNHRYCEIAVRLPKAWGMLEDRVKKIAAESVRRGRVDIAVAVEQSEVSSHGFHLDWETADRYVEAIRQIQSRYALPDTFTANDLLALPGILQSDDKLIGSPDDVEGWLAETVQAAADDLLSMKRAEGMKLCEDLRKRLDQIAVWTDQIRALAPHATAEHRQRLLQRLEKLKEELPFELDEQRLAQEIVLFAERSDISEETTRMISHCTQFSEQLSKEEAVGRKLDFLLQEMNREANTIASKANYLPIQRLAVDIKTELEKMREQVQNIE
ncbi:YicC family protein [Brevibacillus sp. SYP-B805]|uniref:YicC/YloC family endoribonuclease n=1 Tax=Brevibacillus sp. SYP-B805 TaxID=1578199 RepID=UPI0013EA6240|nr:YicC/YloC family endoribonuclease [Brevibacillus sp. SYP-B805]NGQ93807.1 YicC family protein [Brevibacillus sp. SYP-B805]